MFFFIKVYLTKRSLYLAGCPNGCSRHGQCLLEDGVYHCSCADGWAGTDCSIALELSCNDNEDNDEGNVTTSKWSFILLFHKSYSSFRIRKRRFAVRLLASDDSTTILKMA